MRYVSFARRRRHWSLMWVFAVRSAVVFLLVGVVLHFLVERLVEQQFHEHAEFHAVFVTEAVLQPALMDLDLSSGASDSELLALASELRAYVVDLDDAVYHVVVWDPDGEVLAADDVAHLGVTADGYGSLLSQTATSGALSVDGAAPYLVGDPPVRSTLRTFVPFELGRPLVAEIHQDWSPTLAASRIFSRTLDAGLFGGIVLLWALSLPRQMDIQVLAEGIETQAQLDAVTLLGFDLAQGYHLARPAPAAVVDAWLVDGLPTAAPVSQVRA